MVTPDTEEVTGSLRPPRSPSFSREDRILHQVGERLALSDGSGVAVACSALKRRYRDLLREHAPTMLTIFARGPIGLIQARIAARRHEYMPISLLQTQLDDLEERQADEPGLTVDIAKTPEWVVERIMKGISEGMAHTTVVTVAPCCRSAESALSTARLARNTRIDR